MAGLGPLGPARERPETWAEYESNSWRPREEWPQRTLEVQGFLGDQVKKRLAPQRMLIAGVSVVMLGLILESRLARFAAAGGAGLAVLSLLAIEEKKDKGKKK